MEKYLVASALLFAVVVPVHFAAAADCGDIITSTTTIEITNCNNPFGASSEPSPFTLRIEGEVVSNNSEISIIKYGINSYEVESAQGVFGSEHTFYLHDGDNYREVNTTPSSPTEYDLERLVGDYFSTYLPDNPHGDLYVQYLLGNPEVYNDPNWDWDILDNLSSYVEGTFVPYIPYLLPGTYTLVSKDIHIYLVDSNNQKHSFWQELLETIIPTAHAQYIFPPDPIYTLTFTLSPKEEVPTGASSVLFLPGIQASRLYLGDGNQVSDRLWEPSGNDDVATLSLDENGESIVDIRTNDIVDEAAVPFLGGNIYKGFISFMNRMVNDEEINEWTPFAYDWRYDVFDVVKNGTKYLDGEIKNPVDELIRLSANSKSGKVTIVAHSNGGLLAKAILIELESRGRSDLVDKIIFIGTPHLGTPKAIGTILHGYDQQKLGGLIIEDKVARETISNMPGAYALLPSEKYLSKSSESIITFSEGESTQFLVDEYGTEISSMGGYVDFLNGKEGRVSDYENISIPYTTNSSILDNVFKLHKDLLDNWSAPDGVEVHDIIGVGLPTIKAVEYRDVVERIDCNLTIYGVMVCNDPVHFMRPYAHFTQYGDETVTALSSGSVSGEKYYFDFESYNKSLFNPFESNEHANFTEVDEIQDIVKNIINSTSTKIDYISSDLPSFTKEYEVISIDSPVRMIVEDDNGNRTGLATDDVTSIVKEIPNSNYFEFGGTKYLIMPRDLNTKVSLFGEGYGSYTLRVATLSDSGEQIVNSELINATTTPDMVATFTGTNGTYSTISIDTDGDGKVDVEQSLNGEIISEIEKTYSYSDLELAIKDLYLKQRYEKLLLLEVRLAESFSRKSNRSKIFLKLEARILKSLSKTINRYERRGLISEGDLTSIEEIINNIK